MSPMLRTRSGIPDLLTDGGHSGIMAKRLRRVEFDNLAPG